MKKHLEVFLVVALAALAELPGVTASSVEILSHCVACPDEFRGMLVCAFINGCYLEIEYCSMVVFNCGRQQHHKHCEDHSRMLIKIPSNLRFFQCS